MGTIDTSVGAYHNRCMPHRTVFQWGKNEAHPFTVFMGGVVIGALVTGALAWAWAMSDEATVEINDVVIPVESTSSPSPRVSPSASPTASNSSNDQPQF